MSSSAWANKLPQDHYLYDLLDGKSFGLFFGNGGYWKESRKLVLRLLHQFGFFWEEIMEKIVQFELRELLQKEFFAKIEGRQAAAVLPMHHMFQVYTLNVVVQVLLGNRFQPEDPTLQRMLSAIKSFNESFNPGMGLLDLFPWLRHIPFLRFHRNLVEFNNFFKEYCQVKGNSFSEQSIPFGLILSFVNFRKNSFHQEGSQGVIERIQLILWTTFCWKWINGPERIRAI